MAKMIKEVKDNGTKRVLVSAVIDGEELKVRTAKKCVGKMIHASLADENSVCSKCQASGSQVSKICKTLSGEAKKAETETGKVSKKKGSVKTGNTEKKGIVSSRPFNCAIQMWLNGDKKETVVLMAIEKGMKEAAAKRFVNDIFSVGQAAVGKARKSGGLIESYLNWAIYGIGEEPTGCKATIGFCKQYAPAFVKLGLE